MAKTAQLAPELYSKPPKTAIGGARFDFRSMELTKAQLEVAAANNAIIAFGVLPAGHRLAGLVVECDDLSEAADIVFNVGILNSYYDKAVASASNKGFDNGTAPALVSASITLDDGTVIAYGNILTGATIGQTGGRVDTLALAPMNNIGVDKLHDRIVAIDITTQATAGKAGTIGLGLLIDQD